MSTIIAPLEYLIEIITSIVKIQTIKDQVSGRVIGYAVEFPRRERGEMYDRASFAIIILTGEDVIHRHSQTTETYIGIHGKGAMAYDDDLLVMEPGDSYRVAPGTWHAAMPLNGGKLVFACVSEPTFYPNDYERHPTEGTGWFNRRAEQVAPGFES